MIQLPKAYTQEHQQLTLKYLAEGRRVLSSAEWKKLLTGFDVLHKASIITPTERMTFAEWYERQIDRVFAEPFIAALLRLENVAREQEALCARFAREIVQTWTASELRQQERSVGNVLMAYCLYFWESFATGYAFEVEIYRDLRKEGIAFVAHDIRNRLARFSAYDLKVLNFGGDVTGRGMATNRRRNYRWITGRSNSAFSQPCGRNATSRYSGDCRLRAVEAKGVPATAGRRGNR